MRIAAAESSKLFAAALPANSALVARFWSAVSSAEKFAFTSWAMTGRPGVKEFGTAAEIVDIAASAQEIGKVRIGNHLGFKWGVERTTRRRHEIHGNR
ncbi:MAG: hypothetical protein AAB214_15860 [Fibrobacterota bacterium]